MIVAFDTYYWDEKAKTVAVCFKDWPDATPIKIVEEVIEGVAPYKPGAFYKRELPCILSLLKIIELNDITCIIIDGFVVLNDEGDIGLGGYLYQELKEKIPVIGVAKSGFHNNKKHVKTLLRGESKKPLYISALGISVETAYQNIKHMHGDFRIPTLLQIMDTKTKEK